MENTGTLRTSVAQLYVALFGRAPDAEGLAFWTASLEAGSGWVGVANAMFATSPARAYYPAGATAQGIIASFYLNVLGRAADAAGLSYWTAKLAAPGADAGAVIAEMIDVVANYKGADPAGVTSAALFNNRVAVAQYYGEQGGNVGGASDVLRTVTAEARSVGMAKAAVDGTALLLHTKLGLFPVDFDALPKVVHTELRNEIDTWVGMPGETLRATLLDLSALQAAGLGIRHAITGNSRIANNVIVAASKVDGVSDRLAITILDGVNADARFNFTIDTVVANTDTSNTASLSTFENVTLIDLDSESNSVALQSFAQHTGTITLVGGKAGTFLNLDVDTLGADVAPDWQARSGTSLVLTPENRASDVQQGLYQLDTNGGTIDMAPGHLHDVRDLSTQVRLVAERVDATEALSDVILRVGTRPGSGGQAILLGSGDDSVIFDQLGDARAGLSAADTVQGGTGYDTLVIDGNTRITIGAADWAQVSGFEALVLVGMHNSFLNAPQYAPLAGQAEYNLVLTDALIAANHGTDGRLRIDADGDANNDTVARIGTSTGERTRSATVVHSVCVDARALGAQSHFSFQGDSGAWLDMNQNGLYDGKDIFITGSADRFLFSETSLNAGVAIDGGAWDNDAQTWDNGSGVLGGSDDVLEIRGNAAVTSADLANIRNVGSIAGVGENGNAQLLVLQLTDDNVDALVDGLHRSTASQQETLWVRMNHFGDVAAPTASAQLQLDVSSTTARSIVNVSLDSHFLAVDSIRLGFGQTWVKEFQNAASLDQIVLSVSHFGLGQALTGASNRVSSGHGVVFGLLNTGASTDRVYVVEGQDVDGNNIADSLIYFDADGSGLAAAQLIAVVRDVTLSAGAGLDFVA